MGFGAIFLRIQVLLSLANARFYTMFPVATADPFSRNVGRRGILANFSMYSSFVRSF